MKESSEKGFQKIESVKDASDYLRSLATEYRESAKEKWGNALNKLVQAIKTAIKIVVKAISPEGFLKIVQESSKKINHFLDLAEIGGKKVLSSSYEETKRQLSFKARILMKPFIGKISPINFSALSNQCISVLAI